MMKARRKSISTKLNGKHDIPNKRWILIGIGLVFSILFLTACFLTNLFRPDYHIKDGEAFEPETDVTIEGGSYSVPSIDIPDDVTVTVDEDVQLFVEGDANITGKIQADCADMTLDVNGGFIFSGHLENPCGEDGESADVTLNLMPDQPFRISGEDVVIDIDGDFIVNTGDVQGLLEPVILPIEPVEEPLPPICSLSADFLLVELDEEGLATLDLTGECVDLNGDAIDSLSLSYSLINTFEIIEAPENAEDILKTGETSLTFPESGHYWINLTAVDEHGSESKDVFLTAYVMDPELEEQPDHLGVAIDLPIILHELGQELTLSAIIENMQNEPGSIAYEWNLVNEEIGWTAFSSEPTPVLTFEEPGIVSFGLTASLGDEVKRSASASIYIYDPDFERTAAGVLGKPVEDKAYDCSSPPAGANLIGNVGPGKVQFKVNNYQGNRNTTNPLMILPNAEIIIKDRAPQPPKVGKGSVLGEDGADGGNLILTNGIGDVVICGGATLIGGNGQDGQDAVATTGAPGGDAWARGGKGGDAGIIKIAAKGDVVVVKDPANLAAQIDIQLGKAGKGGDAKATGGNGKTDCINPTNGGKARAYGGSGGSSWNRAQWYSADYSQWGAGMVINQTVRGGGTQIAGNGGSATANGGDGGDAANPAGGDCFSCLEGTRGGRAKAIGGKGGKVFIKPDPNRVVFGALSAGNGGAVTAVGGKGGDASDCDQVNDGVMGGRGGTASYSLGKGGKNNNPGGRGLDGVVIGQGGDGGDGGDALLTGGPGGPGGRGQAFELGMDKLPDGSDGAPGGMLTGIGALIKLVKINLVDPAQKKIQLLIQFDQPQAGQAVQPGVPKVKQVQGQLGNQQAFVDVQEDDFIDDETVELALFFAEPLADGWLNLTLIDDEGNPIEDARLELIIPEESEGAAAAGSAPVITSVEFPLGNMMDPIANDLIGMPSDGSDVNGSIHFWDEDGDVNYGVFSPMEVDTTFNGFEFIIEEEFLNEGDFYEGAFLFHLHCSDKTQDEQVSLQIRLQDLAGNWSYPAILAIYCP